MLLTKEKKATAGLIKLWYFDKVCKCPTPDLFTKKVDSKFHVLCMNCGCVKDLNK
jgi:hypothetical protein